MLPPFKACTMTYVQLPPCPNCLTETVLTQITSGVSGHALHTFECPACEYVHKLLVALVDPMTSEEVSGWLKGELRAPT